MADCKRGGRDIEDPGTMTRSKNPIAFKDGEYLPRSPYDEEETERCSVCHIMPGGCITKAAIWKNALGAGRDLALVVV
jgi:hypothetical protein